VASFGTAALASLVGALRVWHIADVGVRYGLMALLVTSGVWAASDAAFLLVPSRGVKEAVGIVGLTSGFAAVWAWLYFCSAYSGRQLHRNQWVRLLAVVIFLAVTAVKVTNPIHQDYFTFAPSTEPFPHLGFEFGVLYWRDNVLSYALAAVGYAMLFSVVKRADSGKGTLVGLVGLTALPLVLNATGALSPLLLNINHDALGASAFSLGVLFAYTGVFRDLRLFGQEDEPAITIDENGRVRNYNAAAGALFPSLRRRGTSGQPLSEALPGVAQALEAGDGPGVFRYVPPNADSPEVEPGGAGSSGVNGSASPSAESSGFFQITESRFGAGLDQPGRLLVLSDITDRERQRLSQEAQLQGLIDSVPGVVFQFEVDPDGSYGVSFMSGASTEMVGLAPDTEDAFERFVSSVAPSQREAFLQSVQEAIETQSPWRYEVPFDHPNGERRWLLATSVPETRKDGLCFNGVLLDITPQKLAQRALRAARDSAERARKEAEHAREEAERASRLKSALLANMSHEVRTPLTAIIGFAEVLDDLGLDPPADHFVESMLRSGQRLLRTLTSVLDLAQLEAGTMRLAPEPVDAVAEVRRVLASFALEAEQKDLAMHLDTSADAIALMCDPEALQRIATHLVSNAIKFTPEGGCVQVHLGVADGGAARPESVVLQVADTGRGISPDFLPHLFEAFHQESGGLAREFEGPGLGLAVTHRFVELLGGSIEVDSTEGEGTTFTVHLPRAAEEVAA
jgi:signal transduction histidine kinase